MAESNGTLPPVPRTGISYGTLSSAVEYGLPLPFYLHWKWPARCANCIGTLLFRMCERPRTSLYIESEESAKPVLGEIYVVYVTMGAEV